MSEALALVALAVTLAAAIARPRWAPDWGVALLTAAVVIGAGAITLPQARAAIDRLGPTVGFLAALLVLADGCRRNGLFDALGTAMAEAGRGRPRRLLAAVFIAAAAITSVLSLDATVTLLTPIVFATAARARIDAKPHVYACTHLANSGSLLLPVSNLTNLLAFAAVRVSFVRFAALMVLPWAVAIAVEWVVLTRVFARQLRPGAPTPAVTPAEALPAAPDDPQPIRLVASQRFALAIVGLTLAGFAVSSTIGVAPVWVAAAGAATLTVRAPRPSPLELVRAVDLGFLAFVLGLGIVVAAAGDHGLASAVRAVVPDGRTLPALLAVAAISALLANVVNNIPATLIIVPVLSAAPPAGLLAMLIGVNVGPNLTYAGSLATLLWRRVIHAHDEAVDVVEFHRLGLLTVPASLLLATTALWLALQVP